jgi:hypothetical protein
MRSGRFPVVPEIVVPGRNKKVLDFQFLRAP